MGKGILGPVIDTIPVPSEGKALIMRDATRVAGVVCEIHAYTPQQLFFERVTFDGIAFLDLIRRPAGVDACRDCLDRLMAYLREHRPDVLR